MDKELFKEKLASILPKGGYDREIAHGQSDDLLVEALTDLGYDCSLFVNGDFWYA